MTEPREEQPESPPSVGEQVDEAVRTLTEQSAWMRERLGEEDWRRLTRLRDRWASCRYLLAWGRNVLTLALILMGFGLVMTRLATGSWRPQEFQWSDGGALFVLGPALLVLGWLGAQLTELLLRREVERLMWRGHSPEAVVQALWADLQAKALSEPKREAEARAALAQERTTAPPWWQVELHGAHLVGWMALALLLTFAATGWRVPDWLLPPVWATVVCGLGPKLVFWLLYSLTNPSARLPRLRFYRWWAHGPLPVGLALLPGLFILACVLPQALE